MDDVEKIKQKIDIVDFVGEYVTLKKAGRNFSGICPFHNEKSPSFMISPERQIWHCFGCGKGGDVFTFLMEYDRVEFSESLKYLADKTGIKLTQSVIKNEHEKAREKIFELNRLAAQFYQYLLLNHSSGKTALTYLTEKRQIPTALISKFQLGCAPKNSSALSDFLMKKKKYSSQEIIDAGLATAKGGRVYDFFRNRIIFPITDVRDNIVAFSGRALDDTAMPKYINTRETLVYKKGETAYALSFAKESVKKEGKVIIMEGEFDVISSFKEGISHVVAVKGTALTEAQIKLLKRYARKLLFCFDTDVAGSSAQRRSIEMIEKEGVSAAVIVPPEGKDPDEILRENPAAFKKALKDEVNIYDFIITSSARGINTDSVEGKSEILSKTIPILSSIENEVIKEHYFKKLADILDSSLESLMRQVQKTRTGHLPVVTAPRPKKVASREEMVEEYLLSLLLQAKEPIPAVRAAQAIIQDVQFSTPVLHKIYKNLEPIRTFTQFDLGAFAKQLPTELSTVFDKCCLTPLPEFEDEIQFLKEVEKTAREVRMLVIKKRLKELGESIKQLEKQQDELQLDKLRQEFGNLTQLLQKSA